MLLQYCKHALVGLTPGSNIWPGVYPLLSEAQGGCSLPTAFMLKTQPAHAATHDGITPLSTNTPTMLASAGLVVQIAELNEAFARVQVSFNASVPPRLTGYCLSNGYVGFEICGIRTGAVVGIERSIAVTATNWDPVTNFTGDGHSAQWFDLASTNRAAAFYRVRTE